MKQWVIGIFSLGKEKQKTLTQGPPLHLVPSEQKCYEVFFLILLELDKRMLSIEQPFASSISSKAWVLGDQFVSRWLGRAGSEVIRARLLRGQHLVASPHIGTPSAAV